MKDLAPIKCQINRNNAVMLGSTLGSCISQVMKGRNLEIDGQQNTERDEPLAGSGSLVNTVSEVRRVSLSKHVPDHGKRLVESSMIREGVFLS